MISVEPIVIVSQLWDVVIIASRANMPNTSKSKLPFFRCQSPLQRFQAANHVTADKGGSAGDQSASLSAQV